MSSKIVRKIAVMSDMHCHEHSRSPKGSHLLAGALKLPASNHPVSSLRKLIDDNQLSADFIVCPGDFADRVCQAGMHEGWNALNEVANYLDCKDVIATLGNHDVDSRKQYSDDSTHIPKNLSGEFLNLSTGESAEFWAHGFFVREICDVRVIVINTVADHNSEASAKRGSFNQSRLEHLDATLSNENHTGICIALMHHHPILHDVKGYTTEDVIPTGDAVLEVLSKHGVNIIIHGHRHSPRLKLVNASHGHINVFGAGSFSAVLEDMYTYTRNLFHILEVELDESSNSFRGAIKTWEFNLGSGWNPATVQSASITHTSAFGSYDLENFVSKVASLFEDLSVKFVNEEDIRKVYPELSYLSDDILSQANQKLNDSAGIKLFLEDTVQGAGKVR